MKLDTDGPFRPYLVWAGAYKLPTFFTTESQALEAYAAYESDGAEVALFVAVKVKPVTGYKIAE